MLPGIAAMREDGDARVVTTVFPSVTGPAYLPFFTGLFPGPLGVPGLRWYDRARERCRFPDYTRSYLGAEMRHMTGDMARGVPTIFERVESRYAALSIISRGLARHERLGDNLGFVWKAARAHVRGSVAAWLDIDRAVGQTVVRRVRDRSPELVLAAFMGVDKTSTSRDRTRPRCSTHCASSTTRWRSGAGTAMLAQTGDALAYRPIDGDPLGIGAHERLDAEEAHAACAGSEYPDAIVQLLSLAGSPRSGDVLLSAAPGHDFRARGSSPFRTSLRTARSPARTCSFRSSAAMRCPTDRSGPPVSCRWRCGRSTARNR
jgi:hypothetical protein